METTTKTRTNSYAAACASCRQNVEAGAGSLVSVGGRWTVTHLPTCPTPQPIPAGLVEEPLVPQQRVRVSLDEVGVYVLTDGSIVKAQANKAKTRVYAMRWTEINGERLLDVDGHTRVNGEWVFEGGLVEQIPTQGRRMTLGEAKLFILRYGKCVRCSRKLKAAESVERGIGPVCVTYFSFGG